MDRTRLPRGCIVVTPHARDRFRQYFRCVQPDDVVDAKIVGAIRSARKVWPGSHGHGWRVRTDTPVAIRAILEPSYDGLHLVVVTVMPGSKTRGNVVAQKARRAERQAAGNGS